MKDIQNIVRLFLAGKEETSPLSTPEEQSTEAPIQEKVPVQPEIPPVNSRHFFFTANKPIDYKSLVSNVEQFGEEAIEDIKNGAQGTGDNFKWSTAVVKTNEYAERPTADMLLYIATLTSDGKQTSQEQIIDKSGKQVVSGIEGVVTQEDLIKNLKSKIFDEVGRIKFDADAKFINKEYSPDNTRTLLAQNTIPGEITWPGFKENYSGSMYRIWDLKEQKLKTPTFGVNNADNFSRPGNPFLGTVQDIKILEEKAKKATPAPEATAPAAPAQEQEKKEPSVYNPVDEQKEITKDQAEARFQKMANNIVYNMIKEALVSITNPASTTNTSKSKGQGKIELPVELNKPGIDEAQTQLKKLEKVVKDIDKATQMTQTTSPYGNKGALASVNNVINFFLNT